jgi:hypothetical protein
MWPWIVCAKHLPEHSTEFNCATIMNVSIPMFRTLKPSGMCPYQALNHNRYSVHFSATLYTHIANTALSVHNIRYKNWEVPTVLGSTHCDKWERDVCPLAAISYWLCMEMIQLTLMYIMSYCTLRKPYCRRSLVSVGWRDIKHILRILHTASPTANMCMKHKSAHLSQITMCHFIYTPVSLSLICISMLIFPQCSKTIAKTILKVHTCTFEIIIHVGPSHYYNAKLKPSSVNFLYIIYSNLVLYMFRPNLVNMRGNALQWRAIFAGS